MEEKYRSQLASQPNDGFGDISNNLQVDVDPSIVDFTSAKNGSNKKSSSSGTFAANGAIAKPRPLTLLRSKAKKLICKAIKFKRKERIGYRKKTEKVLVTRTLQPELFRLTTLYALIFIALREIGCDVVFSDILRYVLCDTFKKKVSLYTIRYENTYFLLQNEL